MYEFPTPEPDRSEVEQRLRRGRNIAVGGALAVLFVALGLLIGGIGRGGDAGVSTADGPGPTSTSGAAAGDGEGAAEIEPAGADSSPGQSTEDSLVGTSGAVTAQGTDIAEGDPDDDDMELISTGDGAPVIPNPPAPPAPSAVEPASLDPVDPPAVTPCDAVLAKGENLLVTPDPVVLPDGALSSTLEITNCGQGPVDWTASTKPWVALGSSNGTLAGGSTAVLPFDIDRDAVPQGAFDFRIKVSEPGHNTYVDVNGYRKLVGTEFQAPGGGFTAGAGAGGCANQCISSALLTSNVTSANMDIDVRTKVPAAIEVYVSTTAPVDDSNGDPHFPGVGMIAFSSGRVSEFSSPIRPLEAATDYFIVVVATDENGKSSHRSGSFRTRTPVELPGTFDSGDPGGCSRQCITTAQLTAGADALERNLAVTATVDAAFTLWVGTSAPPQANGQPNPLNSDRVANSSGGLDTTWNQVIGGLAHDTTYHITLAATDGNGFTAYQTGQFTTGPAPSRRVRVSVDNIRIAQPGDRVGRGEIQFGFSAPGYDNAVYEEERLGRGDQALSLWTSPTFVFDGVTEFVPQVKVVAQERDLATFALPMQFSAIGPGINDDASWNHLTSGLTSLDWIAEMPDCSELGYTGARADDKCWRTSTDPDLAEDFPGFAVTFIFRVD